MKDLIIKTETELGNEIEEILEYITDHPEVGGKEVIAVNYLTSILSNYGFEVKRNYKNYPTAFYASLKNGNGPKIGYLAKYDAIPKFDENGNDAHGCGHNWIASVCVGVGMVLSKIKQEFSGEIVIIGVPPEVFYGERIMALQDREWETFDVVFATHLNDKNVFHSFPLPVNTLELEFLGKASQAFSYPEKGINALDAMLNSITKMKTISLMEEDRVSIIICDGGKSTEMIPEYCRMRVAIGATNKERTDFLTKQMINMAEVESAEFNVQLKTKIYNEFLDLKKVPELYSLMGETFDIFEEEYFLYPKDKGRTALDISPVSYLCPLIFMFFGVENWTPHQPTLQRIDASHSANAKKVMHKAIQIFSYCALKLYKDRELVNKIKKSFVEEKN